MAKAFTGRAALPPSWAAKARPAVLKPLRWRPWPCCGPKSHPDLANGALVYLVRQKDSFGTWYSTQATVLSLKALLQSVRGNADQTNAQVTITLNGGQAKTLTVTPENFDVVQMVSFEDVNVGRENVVAISAEGKGSLMYQVAGSYYLPWDELAKYPEMVPAEDLVTIEVAYDRTELAVNDTADRQRHSQPDRTRSAGRISPDRPGHPARL